MSKLTNKISYYALYVMFAAIVVVMVIFYAGGEMESPIVPDMSNPAHTDALLFLVYALLGTAVVVTVIAFIYQFGSALKENPMGAVKSLIGIILVAVVLLVSWSMGSEEALVLPGYDGTENVPFWLKLTDMFLYTIYFLLAATILSIFGSSIKKKLS